MTEREKMAQIIADHLCPQGRAHKTLYGAERMCYSRNNFADCEKVSECVDALIAANIGDVTAWKEQVVKEIQKLQTENAELRARLEKAVELPRIVHPNAKEWFVQYQNEYGLIFDEILYSERAAEARLKELRGGEK